MVLLGKDAPAGAALVEDLRAFVEVGPAGAAAAAMLITDAAATDVHDVGEAAAAAARPLSGPMVTWRDFVAFFRPELPAALGPDTDDIADESDLEAIGARTGLGFEELSDLLSVFASLARRKEVAPGDDTTPRSIAGADADADDDDAGAEQPFVVSLAGARQAFSDLDGEEMDEDQAVALLATVSAGRSHQNNGGDDRRSRNTRGGGGGSKVRRTRCRPPTPR